MFGSAAAIGFTPAQVKDMSIWEFSAALDGYIEAHCPDESGAISAQEEDDLWSMVQEQMGLPN